MKSRTEHNTVIANRLRVHLKSSNEFTANANFPYEAYGQSLYTHRPYLTKKSQVWAFRVKSA